MNISRSKVKFMQDGKLYTFLQKDEDSGLRFYHDGEYINLVTKNEVLINMPDVTYLNNHRIFYYLHGQCIQLAVYEDITGGAYTITFNNENTLENNGHVTTHDKFTTGLDLGVKKVNVDIEYNEHNNGLLYNEYILTNENSMTSKTATVSLLMEDINMRNENVECVNTKEGSILYTEVKYAIENINYIGDISNSHNHVNSENNTLLSTKVTYTITHKAYDETSTDQCNLINIERKSKGAILQYSEEIRYKSPEIDGGE